MVTSIRRLSRSPSSNSSAVVLVVLCQLLASTCLLPCCSAYVPQEIKARWKKEGYSLDQAMKTIEEAAEAGEDNSNNELYYAVRYVDRHAHLLYKDSGVKEDLFQKAHGSWELRLAYEEPHNMNFIPYPDFRDYAMAFVMVEDDYFGKGIAQNPFFCFVAMGGPAGFNLRTRQLYMDYEDFYISGQQTPEWDMSYFTRGYAQEWMENRKKKGRPPLAFTLIAASDKAMCVRGSKTGGMAIFRRLEEDMRPVAYGADGR